MESSISSSSSSYSSSSFNDSITNSSKLVHSAPKLHPGRRFKSLVGSCWSMAEQVQPSLQLPHHLKKKKNKKITPPSGKQKKEDLEKEIAELQRVLADEEKIHVFLEEFVHCRERKKNSSGFFIPMFLPQKMKEILTELAMVESEISRLESQIKQLQTEVKQQQKGKKVEVFETKTLHFINKAIKGDYSIRDFIRTENDDSLMSHKGGSFRQEREFSQDRVSKSTTISKPPSPVRDGRHSTTSRRDNNTDSLSEFSPWGLISSPNSPQESIRRYTPNKLSESIMKCLIFIFLRLLRRSRLIELEKSNPATRNTVLSLQLRAETTSNSKTSSSSQQDPYGIFDVEGSVLLRDIGPYKNLVRFTSSSLDLKCIQKSTSVPLFQKLKMLADALEKVDLRSLSNQQKLPFWINMCNACIMQEYLQHGVPSVCNLENMQATINKATLNIGGKTLSAAEIEHILRKSRDPIPAKEQSRDKVDRIHKPNPNVPFALCCGTRSSPAVRIYTSEGIAAELEKSKLEYLQAAITVTREKKIGIPDLLHRSMADFAADEESLADWEAQQLPASGSLRKSIVECIKGGRISAVVEKIPYDFDFLYLLSM